MRVALPKRSIKWFGKVKLVHGVLYVILGCYFGMISQNFGMKIYHYLLF